MIFLSLSPVFVFIPDGSRRRILGCGKEAIDVYIVNPFSARHYYYYDDGGSPEAPTVGLSVGIEEKNGRGCAGTYARGRASYCVVGFWRLLTDG